MCPLLFRYIGILLCLNFGSKDESSTFLIVYKCICNLFVFCFCINRFFYIVWSGLLIISKRLDVGMQHHVNMQGHSVPSRTISLSCISCFFQVICFNRFRILGLTVSWWRTEIVLPFQTLEISFTTFFVFGWGVMFVISERWTKNWPQFKHYTRQRFWFLYVRKVLCSLCIHFPQYYVILKFRYPCTWFLLNMLKRCFSRPLSRVSCITRAADGARSWVTAALLMMEVQISSVCAVKLLKMASLHSCTL